MVAIPFSVGAESNVLVGLNLSEICNGDNDKEVWISEIEPLKSPDNVVLA